jgi:hypothetical protein
MQESFGETLLAVGYGLLPSNTATGQIYHVLTIAAEVEEETNTVLDASITLVTPVTARWVERLIVGRDLTSEADTERFVTALDRRFIGNSGRAIAHAYRDMAERYVSHLARLEEAGPE